MKNRGSNVYESLILIFLAYIIVLSYFTEINLYYLEPVLFILMFITTVLFHRNIVVCKYNRLWMLATIMPIISCIYSSFRSESFKYCMLLAFFNGLSLYCMQKGINYERIINWLTYLTGFHVVVTLIQLLSPNIFYSFASMALKGESLTLNKGFWSHGTYCGLHDNPALNGFFISIFVLCIFCQFLMNDRSSKNLRNIIMIVCGCITLIFTQKRSFMLFVLAIAVAAWYIGIKRSKYKGRYFLITALLLVIAGFAVYKYGIFELATSKMLRYIQAGDISNGRLFLWKESIKYFNKSPIFGIGIRTISSLLGDDSHNIYIQLLAEVGLIGAITFYIALLTPAVQGVRLLLKGKSVNKVLFITTTLQVLFLLYGITANPLFDHKMMWIYAVVVGVFGGVVQYEQK